jgi:hypothetical protein
MKISFRTHPILEKIYQGTLETPEGILSFASDSEFIDSVESTLLFDLWEKLIPDFKKEINHISESFLDAFSNSNETIMTLLNTRFESEIFDPNDPLNNVRGTFIIDDLVYTLRLEQKSHHVNGAVFVFRKDGVPMSIYLIVNNEINEWVSNSCQSNLSSSEIIGGIWGLAVFKKYAEVETITVPPLQRKKFDGIKRINDTKLNICYLDSKWFRNIIRNEDFNVRGHFRLQPFGKGRSERRPIWINQFVKHGYTLQARKKTA